MTLAASVIKNVIDTKMCYLPYLNSGMEHISAERDPSRHKLLV